MSRLNIRTRNNVSVNKEDVGYTPIINIPAIDMFTVYEINDQAMNIMKHHETPDQTLYARVTETAWVSDKLCMIELQR